MLFISTLQLTAQQITQWRGEGRRGIYPDKNLMDLWPEAVPKMVLQLYDIGNGFGAPIITNEAIFYLLITNLPDLLNPEAFSV